MVGKEIEQILNVLAERFGTTVEMLWGVLLRQVHIEAIGSFFMAFVTACVGLMFFFLVKWFNENHKPDYCDLLDNNGRWFWCSVLMAICFIICVASVWSGVVRLMNPEFYVIRFILNSL